MPNHVTTILRCDSREPIAHMLSLTDDGRTFFDFNQIIPEPENIERGGCSGTHAPGVVCWYRWHVDNWGTKWGAYEFEERDGDGVKFETAWEHPSPVIAALSRRFPEATLHVEYADEDLGSNQGEYVITDGAPIDLSVPDRTDAAYDHAALLNYGCTYADLQAQWAAEDA